MERLDKQELRHQQVVDSLQKQVAAAGAIPLLGAASSSPLPAIQPHTVAYRHFPHRRSSRQIFFYMTFGAHSICPQKQNQIRWSGRVGASILRFFRFCLTRAVGAALQRICSLSRSVGAERTGADIWSAIKVEDFVRQKQGFLRQVLLCLVICFHFGLAQFTRLPSSFGRFADEEESSDNALTCPAQSRHGVQAQISSLSFVNRKATSSRLLARVVVCFLFGLAFSSPYLKLWKLRRRGKQWESALTCTRVSAVAIWSSGAHAPMPDQKWQPSYACRFSILILSSRPKKLRRKTTSQKPLRPHESMTQTVWWLFFRDLINLIDHEETWLIIRFKLHTGAGGLIFDLNQLFRLFWQRIFRNWSGTSAVLDPVERARLGQIQSAPGLKSRVDGLFWALEWTKAHGQTSTGSSPHLLVARHAGDSISDRKLGPGGRSSQRGWRCIIGHTLLRMVRWCIRLTRLTLVCEVIMYRLVQVRQNHKKESGALSIDGSFIWSTVQMSEKELKKHRQGLRYVNFSQEVLRATSMHFSMFGQWSSLICSDQTKSVCDREQASCAQAANFRRSYDRWRMRSGMPAAKIGKCTQSDLCTHAYCSSVLKVSLRSDMEKDVAWYRLVQVRQNHTKKTFRVGGPQSRPRFGVGVDVVVRYAVLTGIGGVCRGMSNNSGGWSAV